MWHKIGKKDSLAEILIKDNHLLSPNCSFYWERYLDFFKVFQNANAIALLKVITIQIRTIIQPIKINQSMLLSSLRTLNGG